MEAHHPNPVRQGTKMKWVYVAAPYTLPDPVENTNKAIKAADELIRHGFFPIIPHLTLLWHIVSPRPEQFWYDYTMGLMGRCDIVLRLPGHSKGGDQETEAATANGQPVYHSLEELLGCEQGDLDGISLAGSDLQPQEG